jgi:hypothetical protein
MKIRKTNTIALFLWIFLAISIPAYPADNAVITGDGVRVRENPSLSGKILTSLNRSTRVTVIGKTDFSETIGGHTAPWYQVSHGDITGFVFGRFLELDSGKTTGGEERVLRFIKGGLEKFGKTESEILKRLGDPISLTSEKVESVYWPGKLDIRHRLVYDGVVVGIHEYSGGEKLIHMVTVAKGPYEFDGLKVGRSISDVRRLLGDGQLVDGDKLIYHDYAGYYMVTFTISDGAVVEIMFSVETSC